ncbi:MAG: CPBP family intramembrane metalloprotease [Sphingomonadaceae bacterium]|jgi:hypothetical protein|nr:CPBP family intramembrane metalloprotease [Sphingomonadaceae bacterium]
MSEAIRLTSPEPAWRKLWQHPLVVVVVAASLLLFAWRGFAAAMVRWDTQLPYAADLAIRELLPLIAVLAVYKLVVTRMGRFVKDDLPMRAALVDTSVGLLAGMAMISTAIGIATLFGAYTVYDWGWAYDILEMALIVGFSAAIIEEVLLRGVLFRWLEEAGGSMLALAATTLLVGAVHAMTPGATPISTLANATALGLLTGAAYMLTRSLWLAIGIHAAWNMTQGLVWGTPIAAFQFDGFAYAELYGPDWLTGGVFGINASAVGLVVALAFALWAIREAKRQGHWLSFGWRRGIDG